MKDLKINIIYKFREGPWGGGNQFLKALKDQFELKGYYENNPLKANCFIFNSHHFIEDVLYIKLRTQDRVFIHRLAGPLSLTKRDGYKKDYKIYNINRYIANGTIFQSMWSKNENILNGFKITSFIKIINNAPDDQFFYRSEDKKERYTINGKYKLIANSWSKNLNKGFELFKYLDENLDFKKFSMKFVGNSPFSYKNIEHIKPVNSKKLADLLRESDIFITGAVNEACSNSILEALQCGLPCIAPDNSSNGEIIKKGGELFKNFEECIEKIWIVSKNYEKYRKNIKINDIDEISDFYIDFLKKVNNSNKYRKKKLRIYDYYKFLLRNNLFQVLKMKKIIIRDLTRIKFLFRNKNKS